MIARPTTKINGFTLIEVMIAVVIIGTLAAIAYPSYTQYVIRARRVDAQRALTDIANKLERNYLNASPATYVTTLATIGAADTTEGGFYSLKVEACGGGTIASCYVITAEPALGIALQDSKCTSLTLDSTGSKGSLPSGVDVCWK